MAALAQRQVLRGLAAAALLAAAAPFCRAEGVALSSAAVSASTSTASGTAVSTATVSSSTSAASVAASSATAGVSASSSTAPADASTTTLSGLGPDGTLAERASSALIALATFYSERHRSPFMRLVSDDFDGELGTLEDALSSDFRSYRTIDLSVIPTQVVVTKDKALIVFTYSLNVTDEFGVNNKFAGQAAYTFVDEKGKAKLYRMDRTPIFGTSLSSIDNPMARSQGTAPGQGSSAPGCSGVLAGNASANEETQGFKFSSQSVTTTSSSDFFASGGIFTNNGAGVVDVGPCTLTTLVPPASISGTTASVNIGDCYAFRTGTGQYAAIKALASGASFTFQYVYQPNGSRCF